MIVGLLVIYVLAGCILLIAYPSAGQRIDAGAFFRSWASAATASPSAP
jgi:hypothetical protein